MFRLPNQNSYQRGTLVSNLTMISPTDEGVEMLSAKGNIKIPDSMT